MNTALNPETEIVERIRSARDLAEAVAIFHLEDLKVVKTANLMSGHEWMRGFFLVCDQCKLDLVNVDIGQPIKFCPGCGSRIAE